MDDGARSGPKAGGAGDSCAWHAAVAVPARAGWDGSRISNRGVEPRSARRGTWNRSARAWEPAGRGCGGFAFGGVWDDRLAAARFAAGARSQSAGADGRVVGSRGSELE